MIKTNFFLKENRNLFPPSSQKLRFISQDKNNNSFNKKIFPINNTISKNNKNGKRQPSNYNAFKSNKNFLPLIGPNYNQLKFPIKPNVNISFNSNNRYIFQNKIHNNINNGNKTANSQNFSVNKSTSSNKEIKLFNLNANKKHKYEENYLENNEDEENKDNLFMDINNQIEDILNNIDNDGIEEINQKINLLKQNQTTMSKKNNSNFNFFKNDIKNMKCQTIGSGNFYRTINNFKKNFKEEEINNNEEEEQKMFEDKQKYRANFTNYKPFFDRNKI